MTIVSLTYINSPAFKRPQDWVRFIKPYFGIFEQLCGEHSIHCFEQIGYKGEYQEAGIHYHFLNFHTKINRFPFRLHRAVRKVKPDVVFVRGLHFPLQVMMLRRALGKQVKIIVQHHAGLPFRGWKGKLQRMADKRVDRYLFADRQAATVWTEGKAIATADKISETGMLSSVFAPMEKQKAREITGVSGAPVFLWVGALNHNKDPLTVVKSFLTYNRYANAGRLYMIFHNNELLETVKSLLRNEGQYNDAVVLVGKMNHEQLGEWYNSADFIISGSHRESFGVAICEAMSCGCIPLVTDISSFRLMTGNGACGFTFHPGDENGLFELLLKTRKMDLATESEKALRQFREQLSFSAIAARLQNLMTT